MTPHEPNIPSNKSITFEKLCPRCHAVKDCSAFPRNRTKKDGRHPWCKKCDSEYRKSRPKVRRTPSDLTAYFVCSTCKISKIATDFRLNSESPTGINRVCKKCVDKRNKLQHESKPELRKQQYLRSRAKNRDRIREQMKSWPSQSIERRRQYEENRRLKNPLRAIELTLKKHCVTLEWYNKKLAGQRGVCAICASNDTGSGKRLAIDHDHSCCPSGKSCEKCRRGLLCFRCNTWIERLERIPVLAKRASSYLREYSKTKEDVDNLPLFR